MLDRLVHCEDPVSAALGPQLVDRAPPRQAHRGGRVVVPLGVRRGVVQQVRTHLLPRPVDVVGDEHRREARRRRQHAAARLAAEARALEAVRLLEAVDVGLG
jgi:hypothetical protein